MLADGRNAQVVGVMPQGFSYPPGADVWLPREAIADTSGRTSHNLRVIARLAPSVTLAAAQAEMTVIARRLEQTYGADHDGTDASVIPLHERTVAGSRQLLLILLGGVGIVLLATCANVANMVIARGADRRRELALRQAIGAGRGELVRCCSSRTRVLGAVAAVAGLLVAIGLLRGLLAVAPDSIPRLDQVSIDTRTALFALALGLLTPLTFGLLPSLQLSRTPLREVLAEGGRSGSAGGSGRTRQGLVALEIAVALLLVTAAGLLGRSFLQLLRVDPGFVSDHVVTVETTMPRGSIRTRKPPRGHTMCGSIGWRACRAWSRPASSTPRRSAGSTRTAASCSTGSRGTRSRTTGSRSRRCTGLPARATSRRLACRFGAGARSTTATCRAARPWPSSTSRWRAATLPAEIRSASGSASPAWTSSTPGSPSSAWCGDVRFRDLAVEALPEVFVNYRQLPMRTLYFITTAVRLRDGLTAEAVIPSLREQWRSIDPDVPVEMSRMTTLVERSTASRRFTLTVVGVFGLMALALAAMGVYGILSYSVAQRSREIGIRMALGASSRSIVSLVFGSVAGAVAGGVIGGIIAAVSLTRFLQAFLFGVTSLDPLSFVAAIAALAAVSFLAAWNPIRRASRIDPVVVMRDQ